MRAHRTPVETSLPVGAGRPILLPLALLLLAFSVTLAPLGPVSPPAHAQSMDDPMKGSPDQVAPEDSGGSSEGEPSPYDRDGDGCGNAQRPARGGPIVCDDPNTPGTDLGVDSDDSDPTAGEGEGCSVLGVDLCATAKAAINAIRDSAWAWLVDTTKSVAEFVMNAAFTLPSMDGGGDGLLTRYDQMVQTVKPALIVGVLLLAFSMMLQSANYNAHYATLHGLPRLAMIGLALAFFPEFVGMMSDATSGIGQAFGSEADVGGAMGKILTDAGTLSTAATLFSGGNVGLGAIVAGLLLLPLLVMFLLILAVAILKNVLFGILVLLGPIALVCWAMPGLQSITGVWFRSLMACFLIPVLFTIETTVGSWVVDSPTLLINGSPGEGGTWIPALSSICLLVLLVVMCATPKKVLDWSFSGAMGGGGFSMRTLRRNVSSFFADAAKMAVGTAAGGTALGAALQSSSGKRNLGALLGARTGAKAAETAKGLGATAPAVLSRGRPQNPINTSPGQERGIRHDPDKKADPAKEFDGELRHSSRENPSAQDARRREQADGSKDSSRKQASAARSTARRTPASEAKAGEESAKEALATSLAKGHADSASFSGPVSDDAGDGKDLGGAAEEESLSSHDFAAAGTPEEAMSSLRNSAQENAAQAAGEAYDQTYEQALKDNPAMAQRSFDSAAALRQQSSQPGLSLGERGSLRTKADLMDREGKQMLENARGYAHARATRAFEGAQAASMGNFAGGAADHLATQRAEAAPQLTAVQAVANRQQAGERLERARHAFDEATSALEHAGDMPAGSPALQTLQHDHAQASKHLDEARADYDSWDPAGGHRYQHLIDASGRAAYQEEYDRAYSEISGHAPHHRSPGYAPQPPTPNPPSPAPEAASPAHAPVPEPFSTREATPRFGLDKPSPAPAAPAPLRGWDAYSQDPGTGLFTPTFGRSRVENQRARLGNKPFDKPTGNER